MTTPGGGVGAPRDDAFVHEALFYSGLDEFVSRSCAFIDDSLAASSPVLVVVTSDKVHALRAGLGADATRVQFADMRSVGRNPGRIISLWRDFINEHAMEGMSVRGIGEPIWAERSDDELVEAQRHETLINVAFTGANGWIVCGYDTSSLSPEVIEEALRSHPIQSDGTTRTSSDRYVEVKSIPRLFDHPLPGAPPGAQRLAVDIDSLGALRRSVTSRATAFGLGEERTTDLILAVNEVATNSIRHGGGRAVARIWEQQDALVLEISDSGMIDAPLVGRQRPVSPEGGYGLWIVNQLCDLVQVRSFDDGTVVRMHMSRA